jgi:hypothetical protein
MDNVHIAINSNNNNVTTTNNITNITNNISFPSILGYGVETNQIDVINTLTDKDKDAIIKSSRLALDKIRPFGSTISLKNVIVTNLTKKYAYKYDDREKFHESGQNVVIDLFEQRSSDLNRYTTI